MKTLAVAVCYVLLMIGAYIFRDQTRGGHE
jgi:hypothetical protein